MPAFSRKGRACRVLAANARLSAQGLAFNAVGRYCILNDPVRWRRLLRPGATGRWPGGGAHAAHITYLSDEGMHRKFGRRLQGDGRFRRRVRHRVSRWRAIWTTRGAAVVERFDANSYLFISRAMDYYDASVWGSGDLTEACGDQGARAHRFFRFGTGCIRPRPAASWPWRSSRPASRPAIQSVLALRSRLLSRRVPDGGAPGEQLPLALEAMTHAQDPRIDPSLVARRDASACRLGFLNGALPRWLPSRLLGTLAKVPSGANPRWQDDSSPARFSRAPRVLDLGCGDGQLLERLQRERQVRGQAGD